MILNGENQTTFFRNKIDGSHCPEKGCRENKWKPTDPARARSPAGVPDEFMKKSPKCHPMQVGQN
jgi:hypothetical protein